jgi:hypothetical protein
MKPNIDEIRVITFTRQKMKLIIFRDCVINL